MKPDFYKKNLDPGQVEIRCSGKQILLFVYFGC